MSAHVERRSGNRDRDGATRQSGRVIGRYALYDEIAAGGMASVHLGRLLGSAGFSRTVAVKCLHPGFTREPEFVSMLLDEAHLASRVRHSNVVQMIDVVSTGSDVFLVMEYVHGESLARLLEAARARGQRMPLPIVASVVAGMLYGLHAAHEATGEDGVPLGIVHRDVSPQNVLVGLDGISRVFDFGVAKAATRLQSTTDGQVKGKLRYMSPEQLRAEPVDRRADVFSASIVLWEALTGRRLFDGVDSGAIVTQILVRGATAPEAFASDVPADVSAVVMKGLAAKPDDRFATARDMAIALERAVGPATAREVGEWVEDVAGEALKARSALVAAVESGAAGAPGSGVRADEPTAPTVKDAARDGAPAELDGTARTSRHAIERNGGTTARSRRVLLRVASGVAIGALSIAAWAGIRSVRRTAMTLAERAPATALADAPASAPTASASVATAAPSAATSPSAIAEPGRLTEPADRAATTPPRSAASPRTAQPAHAASPSAPAPSKADCDPPFVMRNGIKEFKHECL